MTKDKSDMNKQEKKIAIVNNLLDIANNSEKDHKHNFSDVTFFCPGIGDLVDGANGVLVKKLERFNPHPTSRNRFIYKLHFVHIKETSFWETEIDTWDKMDEVTRNQVASYLRTVHDNGTAKVGSAYYFALK
jgi:hypothetical protein